MTREALEKSIAWDHVWDAFLASGLTYDDSRSGVDQIAEYLLASGDVLNNATTCMQNVSKCVGFMAETVSEIRDDLGNYVWWGDWGQRLDVVTDSLEELTEVLRGKD